MSNIRINNNKNHRLRRTLTNKEFIYKNLYQNLYIIRIYVL